MKSTLSFCLHFAGKMADLRLPTQVRQDFHDVGSEVSVPVAAIKALSGVIKRSTATTMMGLQIELKAAADDLKAQQLSHTISLNRMSPMTPSAAPPPQGQQHPRRHRQRQRQRHRRIPHLHRPAHGDRRSPRFPWCAFYSKRWAWVEEQGRRMAEFATTAPTTAPTTATAPSTNGSTVVRTLIPDRRPSK